MQRPTAQHAKVISMGEKTQSFRTKVAIRADSRRMAQTDRVAIDLLSDPMFHVVFAIITIFWGVIRTNKLKGEGYIDGLSPAEQAAILHNKLSSMTKQELQKTIHTTNT